MVELEQELREVRFAISTIGEFLLGIPTIFVARYCVVGHTYGRN